MNNEKITLNKKDYDFLLIVIMKRISFLNRREVKEFEKVRTKYDKYEFAKNPKG